MFEICSGRGEGDRIAVAAGGAIPDEATFIHINEEEFFAVEAFFLPELRQEVGYDHYSPNEIDMSVMLRAAHRMAKFVDRHRGALGGEAEGLGRLLEDLPVEGWGDTGQLLKEGGPQVGLLLLDMLDDFRRRVTAWSSTYPKVFVLGV